MHPHDTTRQCLFCGKAFTLTKKHPNNVYCSRGCVMRKNAIAQRIPPRNCVRCSKEFQAKNRTRQYCSIRCAKLTHHVNKLHHQPVLDRFWARIEKTDTCWNWTRGKTKSGYGQMSVHGRKTHMHRFSYELHFGTIPNGLLVCHHCDNPSCVRPDHLFLGTDADNARDKVLKGRQARGRRLVKE